MVAVPIVTCSNKHIWVTLMGHPTVQVERRYNSDVFDHLYIAQTINNDYVFVMDTKTNKVWKFEIPLNNVAIYVHVSNLARRSVVFSYYTDIGVTQVKDWVKNFNSRNIFYGIILLLLLWTPFAVFSGHTRQNHLYRGFELREGQIFHIDDDYELKIDTQYCYVGLYYYGVSVPLTKPIEGGCTSPRFVFQEDGNLVLYAETKLIWASHLINTYISRCVRVSVDTINKKFMYHF
jgi:hypothetical protein